VPRPLFHDIDPARVGAVLEEVSVAAAGRAEILVACKYVPLEEMGALAAAGVTLVGENRQQDLAAKHERYAEDFTWDFIGNLQSRKVKQILPLVRLIHSVATDSALEQLGRHGSAETEVLVEVNIAEEEGKGGVAPADLADFIARCPVRVSGLMTMPPFAADPEASTDSSVPSLYRTSAAPWIRFCERDLGCSVETIDNYGMKEFTLLARPNPLAHPRDRREGSCHA